VVSGGIFFEEFASLHNGPAGAGGWPLFILGMLSILGGLGMIAPRASEGGTDIVARPSTPHARHHTSSSPLSRTKRLSHEAAAELRELSVRCVDDGSCANGDQSSPTTAYISSTTSSTGHLRRHRGRVSDDDALHYGADVEGDDDDDALQDEDDGTHVDGVEKEGGVGVNVIRGGGGDDGGYGSSSDDGEVFARPLETPALRKCRSVTKTCGAATSSAGRRAAAALCRPASDHTAHTAPPVLRRHDGSRDDVRYCETNSSPSLLERLRDSGACEGAPRSTGRLVRGDSAAAAAANACRAIASASRSTPISPTPSLAPSEVALELVEGADGVGSFIVNDEDGHRPSSQAAHVRRVERTPPLAGSVGSTQLPPPLFMPCGAASGGAKAREGGF
jgi:hypothetical protein